MIDPRTTTKLMLQTWAGILSCSSIIHKVPDDSVPHDRLARGLCCKASLGLDRFNLDLEARGQTCLLAAIYRLGR